MVFFGRIIWLWPGLELSMGYLAFIPGLELDPVAVRWVPDLPPVPVWETTLLETALVFLPTLII